MSNSNSQMKPEYLSDPAPLSAEEQDCLRLLLSEEDLEKCYEGHCETAHRKLWTYFQSAAASLTQLYRERESRRHSHHSDQETDTLWQPFQAAAGSLTQLYRESLEGLRVGNDGIRRSGYQKCRRDIASWASHHRRRYIRRDELLNFLASGMDGWDASSGAHHVMPQAIVSQPPQPAELHQGQLFLEAFSAAEFSAPLANHIEGAAAAPLMLPPFGCSPTGARALKRPLCVTPPPPSSSPSSDKDVNMDTPTSKKSKSDT